MSDPVPSRQSGPSGADGPEAGRDIIEAGALATAVALVGILAYVPAWLLWTARPPLPLEDAALWTTVLLLGLPLVGVYALTAVEVTAFGFVRGDAERGARYVLGLMLLALPVTVVMAFVPAIRSAWPQVTGGSAASGAAGAALALAWRAFVLEWFFRGFVLFGLLRRFGAAAILVQTLAFALLYVRQPWPLAVAAWPAGFLFGFVAWRCRSFLPSALVHIIAILLLQAATIITAR